MHTHYCYSLLSFLSLPPLHSTNHTSTNQPTILSLPYSLTPLLPLLLPPSLSYSLPPSLTPSLTPLLPL